MTSSETRAGPPRVAYLYLAVIVVTWAGNWPLLPVPGERWGLFWVGQLQVAAFLIFSIIGLAIVPAGRAIVLAYTFSLWAIPIGYWLGVEPLARRPPLGRPGALPR